MVIYCSQRFLKSSYILRSKSRVHMKASVFQIVEGYLNYLEKSSQSDLNRLFSLCTNPRKNVFVLMVYHKGLLL